jgi:hypothetical protein
LVEWIDGTKADHNTGGRVILFGQNFLSYLVFSMVRRKAKRLAYLFVNNV